MDTTALAILAGTSIALVAALHAAQRLLLSRSSPPAPLPMCPVSVLKPLRGADPDLESNLESMFLQDHPEFEVILGAADADDPALPIARRVAVRHPHVPCRIVADGRTVGANPKVNNLANLLRRARHEAVLVSDSNVAVPRDHLRTLCAHLAEPGVGLVSAPCRGVSRGTLGSVLEALQLNTFVMGGVAAMSVLVDGVCVVGKTMLLRRADLDAIGGFPMLARYLAEDQVCGEEIRRLGRRVALVPQPVDNVLGPLGVAEFVRRHLRWARIRRWITPAGYAGELLLNPVFLAVVGALVLRTPGAWGIAAATLAVRSMLDAASERRLGVRRPLAAYPLLVLAKDLLTGAAWIVPWFDREVAWRGRAFRIGPRTYLEPLASGSRAPAPESELPLPLPA